MDIGYVVIGVGSLALMIAVVYGLVVLDEGRKRRELFTVGTSKFEKRFGTATGRLDPPGPNLQGGPGDF